MTIEEKAKAYDESLEKAKQVYNDCICCRKCLNELFPVLTESKDEKIRKAIIEYIKTGTYHKDWISWLEKQGEQKPTDKVEPKFKVGDKIQYLKGCGSIMTIEKIENDEYIFGNLGHTAIEDGNKWYLVERNPTWSEEDEKIKRSLVYLIEEIIRQPLKRCEDWKGYIAWLKSLKERVLPQQPKQEWDEEDEEVLNTIINHFEIDLECTENDDIIKWLKSLNPQSRWKPSEQEKAALRNAIQILTKERSFPLLGAHLQNILDAFEGESRIDWKPSDEQMKALADALSLAKNCGEDSSFDLRTLYEQLKKLTE